MEVKAGVGGGKREERVRDTLRKKLKEREYGEREELK